MTEGWWKYAKPGDKVVCVNDRWRSLGDTAYDLCPLTVGAVYEVSGIDFGCGIAASGEVGGFPTAIIAGVPNVLFAGDIDDGWDARRFRPLQTKSTETGMAILKAILHGAPVKEDA